LQPNRQQGLLTEGFSWESPVGTAMLEANEGASAAAKPEFLRLRLARPNATGPLAAAMKNSRGGAATRASDLPANLTRDTGGNVFIRNLPMVDQGNKGYCLPASTQRIFEYYGIGADMHQIAQVAEADPTKGTSSMAMSKELDKIDFRFKTRLSIIAMGGGTGNQLTEVKIEKGEYYIGKPVDERKFLKSIQMLIDDGIPLLWSLELGRYPEEPNLNPQASGGHMRIIIGYNEKSGKIIFTDSWGEGHEFKTITTSDAYKASKGVFVLKPTVR
jgi:Peptidase_C39 like family